MTFLGRMAVAVMMIVGVTGSSAIAESYSCVVQGKYTRGWIVPVYNISYTPGSKTIDVETFTESGERISRFKGQLVSNSSKRMVGRLLWKNAPARPSGSVTVRYRARLDKGSMKFNVTASVGNHGQVETGRGTCKRRG